MTEPLWTVSLGFGIATVWRSEPVPKDAADELFWAMSKLHTVLLKHSNQLGTGFVARMEPCR